jgi:hypothetical protein
MTAGILQLILMYLQSFLVLRELFIEIYYSSTVFYRLVLFGLLLVGLSILDFLSIFFDSLVASDPDHDTDVLLYQKVYPQ